MPLVALPREAPARPPSFSFFFRRSRQTGPFVRAGEVARGREEDGLVVDDEVDLLREGVEGHGADWGARRAVVDGHVRFGAEVAAGARFDAVEDGGLVRGEDLGGAVGQALVVDVEGARLGGG